MRTAQLQAEVQKTREDTIARGEPLPNHHKKAAQQEKVAQLRSAREPKSSSKTRVKDVAGVKEVSAEEIKCRQQAVEEARKRAFRFAKKTPPISQDDLGKEEKLTAAML